MQLPEADWKRFKRLREIALEKYSARILEEIETIKSDAALSSHAVYLKIYEHIEASDRMMGQIFDGYSRSRALHQLVLFRSEKLLEPNEFECLSQEVRDYLEGFST